MLIGRSDMSNVSAFGTCFSIFVYILAHFDFALTSGNVAAQSMASHREIGCKLFFLFLPRHQSTLETLLTGYGLSMNDHIIFGCHQQTQKF